MLPVPVAARRLVAALALGLLVVVGGTAARTWAVARDDDRPRSDVIAVLGASLHDGVPAPLLAARLDHAKDLYDAGVAPRVVVVGGAAPGERLTEAEGGQRYLAQRGVPEVVALGEGRDTLESLRALYSTLQQQGWRSAVLVTDPWHSLRARRMATDLGMRAVTSPARSGPSVSTPGVQAGYLARETVAYLYYRLLGGNSDRGPRTLSGAR